MLRPYSVHYQRKKEKRTTNSITKLIFKTVLYHSTRLRTTDGVPQPKDSFRSERPTNKCPARQMFLILFFKTNNPVSTRWHSAGAMILQIISGPGLSRFRRVSGTIRGHKLKHGQYWPVQLNMSYRCPFVVLCGTPGSGALDCRDQHTTYPNLDVRTAKLRQQ